MKKIREMKPKSLHFLPNLFTIGALFSGFYGIVAATKGMFEIAAVALFIAMLLDNIDGRVARLTNTQSDFGAQLDSMSDMVAFGLAPALIVYHWSLINIGKVGWLVSFFFTAMAALRLAKFNTQVDTADKRFFTGLPAPVAAAIVVGFVWNCVELNILGSDYFISIITAILTAVFGAMMVSDIQYFSFKKVDYEFKRPNILAFFLIVIFIVIVLEPAKVLFLGCFMYALSGVFYTLLNQRKNK